MPLKPSRLEVLDQLQRMLGSQLVASRPKQGELLKLIVEIASEGGEVTEKTLRERLFTTPPYRPESSIARRSIDLLRELLKTYYDGQGSNDQVIVALPKSPEKQRIKFLAGQAYTPTFAYNACHIANLKLRLAKFHLSKMSPNGIELAFKNLEGVTAPGAIMEQRLSQAEALCVAAFCVECVDPKQALELAVDIGKMALEADDASWHAHAITGTASVLLRQYDSGMAHFDRAKKLNKGETESCGWYIAALITVGDYDYAFALTKRFAVIHIDNSLKQGLCALFMYVIRRFELAEEYVNAGFELDARDWLCHLVSALLCTATGRPEEAISHCRGLFAEFYSIGGVSMIMPGLAALLAARTPEAIENYKNRMIDGDMIGMQRLLRVNDGVDGNRPLNTQFALLYLAFYELGVEQRTDLEVVLGFLLLAFADYDPLILWLNRWPLLDGLRSEPGFINLLKHLGMY